MRDTFLVAAVPPVATYLNNLSFYYALAPDYQHLNVVIFAAAVAVFISFDHDRDRSVSVGKAVAADVFVGLCVSNKVSLAVIGRGRRSRPWPPLRPPGVSC